MIIYADKISSVARGGSSSPHWPKKNAKYRVFGTFEAVFCTKNENRPLSKVIGMRVSEEPEMI